MGQKLLLFISILLLFAFNTNAETDLPALPTDSSVKLVDQDKGESVSLWQKILNFFEFGKKEKKLVTEEENNENSNNDITQYIEKTKDLTTDIPEFDSSKLQIKRLDLDLEKTNTDNADNIQDNEPLAIPKGFEEDGPLKLPEGISEDIDSLDIEAGQNIKDNMDQRVDSTKEKLQEVQTDFTDENSDAQVNDDQKTEAIEDLKLPDGFDDIISNDSQPSDGVKASSNDNSDNSKQALSLSSENSQTIDKKPANKLSKNQSVGNDSISDMSLPAPDYASTTDEPQKPESRIEKFTRIFTNKKSKQIELPKITEEDYVTNENGEIKKESIELDSTQLQFVNNEAQVLILPNDDVVLGELTEPAKINEMDLYSYIKLFWKNYYRLKREPQREVIDRFIEEYDENFNQEKFR